jgi:hypothetical protein
VPHKWLVATRCIAMQIISLDLIILQHNVSHGYMTFLLAQALARLKSPPRGRNGSPELLRPARGSIKINLW